MKDPTGTEEKLSCHTSSSKAWDYDGDVLIILLRHAQENFWNREMEPYTSTYMGAEDQCFTKFPAFICSCLNEPVGPAGFEPATKWL